ncbi:hypothetical protein GCM10010329_68240 [Streptomyces spiroverticillatus]|uniref:Uncharacterized protein n=1 Tax=Streptomyces finlayi TaxID=67296 RepID=A0A918X535_9ACTN|nr:hypothetical protein [Streptomyces finlayi]GHA35414.1 hypothetical protein GCM10010329_68240 [Streptomyces spiroverticillatus]GHD12870.1 hypothetical protein GCM10010334_70440 [Streptomyces finlayi]
MWESTGLRGPRPALWRLVLVTVLAGLLHLLGCAHGPQASGAVRADTLPGTSASAYPPPTAAVSSPCTHGTDAGCAGDDEPAASSSRTDLPPPALVERPVLDRAAVRREASVGLSPLPDGGDPGRVRAALGVWRT